MSIKSRMTALLGAVVLTSLGFVTATTAGAAVDSPGWIEAWLHEGRVTAQGWPDSRTVTIFVNGSPVGTTTTELGWWYGYGFDRQVNGVNLSVGDIVTVADGISQYADNLTLTDIGFSSASFETGTYSGWGTPGARAHTCVYQPWQRYRPATDCPNFTVPGSGTWSVSYGVLPPTTAAAYSEVDADGNATAVGGIQGPWFDVQFPFAVQGENWTPNGTVHVTVSDPAFEDDVSTDNGGRFGLALDSGVSAGATVTVSDGTTTKSLDVYVPDVTVNVENDKVIGDAPNGADVVIDIPTPSGDAQRHTVSGGLFSTMFSAPGGDGDFDETDTVDIEGYTTGSVRVYDGDFDYTESFWQAIPLTLTLSIVPSGTVNPASGQATVNLTITASRDAYVEVNGELSQKIGRKGLARGSFGDDFQISTTPITVPITIGPENTPFGSGSAWIEASLTSPNDPQAEASASGYVQLKTLQVKKPHR